MLILTNSALNLGRSHQGIFPDVAVVLHHRDPLALVIRKQAETLSMWTFRLTPSAQDTPILYVRWPNGISRFPFGRLSRPGGIAPSGTPSLLGAILSASTLSSRVLMS